MSDKPISPNHGANQKYSLIVYDDEGNQLAALHDVEHLPRSGELLNFLAATSRVTQVEHVLAGTRGEFTVSEIKLHVKSV